MTTTITEKKYAINLIKSFSGSKYYANSKWMI